MKCSLRFTAFVLMAFALSAICGFAKTAKATSRRLVGKKFVAKRGKVGADLRQVRTWQPKLLAKKWVPLTKGARAGKKLSNRILARSKSALKLKCSLPGFRSRRVSINKKVYQRLQFPGAGRTTRVGYPELPVIKRLIQVPHGQKLLVKNVKSKTKVYSGYNVFPVQPMPEDPNRREHDHIGNFALPFMKSKKGYVNNSWQPSKLVRVGEQAIIRGQKVATVYISPVQYNAKTKKLRVHRDLSYDLAFSGKVNVALQKKCDKRFSAAFTGLMSRSLINFKAPKIASFVLKPIQSLGILNALKGCDYLIITADGFYDALAPFVAHKESKGLIVMRKKLSKLGYGATPTANQIRSYIKNFYFLKRPSPTYVLLVGDANLIPPHYKTNHPKDSELKLKMGTDLYYGCVDGNDKIPDIFVGRFPAKTVAQVNGMVQKSIAFENDIAKDAFWTRKLLMAAYFQDEDPTDGQAEREFLETVERIRSYYTGKKTEKGNGFSITRVYEATAGSPAAKTYRDGSNVPAGVPFSNNPQQAVINALNGNIGFTFHRDHGGSRNGPNGWTEGWCEPRFTTAEVANLNNTKAGVVFSINCRTGWFDGETDKDNGATSVDCLAEALMKRPSPRGAAAVIGSSRNSPSYPNNDLTLGLVEAAYPGIIPQGGSNPAHDVIYHLGPALVFAKNYVRLMWGGLGDINVVREYEMYNLFGDPDLQIRYRKPKWQTLVSVLHRPWLAKLKKRPLHASLKAIKIRPDKYKALPVIKFKKRKLQLPTPKKR